MQRSSVLVFLLLTSACNQLEPCSAERQRYASQAVVMVVTAKDAPGRWLSIEGFEPDSRRSVTFRGDGGFYHTLDQALELGDTLVKRAGESRFLIQKKEFDIVFDTHCLPQAASASASYGPLIQDTLRKP